ncbi:sigma-70 family RNA polymerase sigma factor [Rhizobium rhizogenes]|uniref:sigma-70 family RNA polymerase sigma factor n=1 Tax=Rhizobium rhizogenes TaxID=359 RepID=UPI0022AA8852|nr:sigma-70 family RNA polymerase sigma factor [Rhizobium rhizogenes]
MGRAPAHRPAEPLAPEEFNRLLVNHIPLIKNKARRFMTTHQGVIDELVQIAALYVLENRDHYDPAKGGFGNWLHYQLLAAWGGRYRRAAQNRARYERPIPVGQDGEQFLEVAVFDDPAFRIDLARVVDKMRWLRDADLLFDLYFHGIPAADFARERGVSPQAVNQAMTRARQRLKRALNGEEMLPTDLVEEPHQFVLTHEPVASAADAALAVSQGEERKADRVWFTSTSALSRFVDMMQQAGVVMPSPVAEGRRPVFAMH